MTSNDDSTEWAPVQIHAPLAFDLLPEQPVEGPFGKTNAPMTVLPPVRFELQQPNDIPVLRLTLHLRPDADPAQLALDVLGLIEDLSRCEQDLGGRGVTWNKVQSRAEPQRGVVHLVLSPDNVTGAWERLARLAATATAATTNQSAPQPSLAVNGQSFTCLEATVGGNAA